MSPVTAAVLDAGSRAEGGRLSGKIRDERENLNRRYDRVDGCNSGARLRHGHLSHTLVSSLLRRGESSPAPASAPTPSPKRENARPLPPPRACCQLRRRLGRRSACAGPGAGPGARSAPARRHPRRRPRSASATLPAHLRDGVRRPEGVVRGAKPLGVAHLIACFPPDRTQAALAESGARRRAGGVVGVSVEYGAATVLASSESAP